MRQNFASSYFFAQSKGIIKSRLALRTPLNLDYDPYTLQSPRQTPLFLKNCLSLVFEPKIS